MRAVEPRRRALAALAAVAALASGACGWGEAPLAAPAPGPYPASGENALFLGDGNRIGGTTGGFGDRLGYLDVTYRLGTGVDPSDPDDVDALLEAHASRLSLSDDHRSALRVLLAERTVFRTFEAYFEEGGRIRTFKPPTPEELESLPPERFVLAGDGRYFPDRLVILGRSGEPDMDEFLFHEIQHYVFDRWDSTLFESGDADHQAIALVEERRDIVRSFREGRVPRTRTGPRILGDLDGAASRDLDAGRWAEAIERASSESYYRRWVDGAIGRIEAKNESNRRVRIVSTPLSDGRTLLLDERSDRVEPAELKAMNVRIPPQYLYGPVVYVSLRDVRDLDTERLFAEGEVPEDDRAEVLAFVDAHRRDPGLGRHHIFTEAQVRDLAHLSALNAAIFQAGLHLAGSFVPDAEGSLQRAIAGSDYRSTFSSLLKRLVDRMVEVPGGDPRETAARLLEEGDPRR